MDRFWWLRTGYCLAWCVLWLAITHVWRWGTPAEVVALVLASLCVSVVVLPRLGVC